MSKPEVTYTTVMLHGLDGERIEERYRLVPA